LKVFVAVGILALIAAGLLLTPRLCRERNANEIWQMRAPVLDAAKRTVANGDILRAEWLMHVVRILELEATLVRTPALERPSAPELAKIRDETDLSGYNRILNECLLPEQYKRLGELRAKYDIAQYFKP